MKVEILNWKNSGRKQQKLMKVEIILHYKMIGKEEDSMKRTMISLRSSITDQEQNHMYTVGMRRLSSKTLAWLLKELKLFTETKLKIH